MKHLIVYIMMVIIVVFMVVLINKNQEKLSYKLLTVDTYYSYMDEDDQLIYIDFYLNTDKHPMVDEKSYQSLMIHNQDQTKSMNLNLADVIYQHQETYLNDIYYKYTYQIESPLLGHDFEIEQCYLNVELTNGDIYELYIGSISFKSVYEDEISHLDWKALSGTKQEQAYVSRLNQIDIEYIKLNERISHISVGSLYEVSYELEDDKISINIPYMMQLFYACPVVITFEDNRVQVINYFLYVNDFEVLKHSGQLIYHYALN